MSAPGGPRARVRGPRMERSRLTVRVPHNDELLVRHAEPRVLDGEVGATHTLLDLALGGVEAERAPEENALIKVQEPGALLWGRPRESSSNIR